MNRTVAAMFGSAALVVVMIALLIRADAPRPSADPTSEPLLLFCAASNRAVIEEICADYRAEFGREVHVQYGASQTLLSSLEVTETGDVFLPADDSYIEMALKNELIDEVLPLATMKPVVGVRKGNPKNIRNLTDLSRKDVRLIQASPDQTYVFPGQPGCRRDRHADPQGTR